MYVAFCVREILCTHKVHKQPNAKLKLKNDIFEWLAKNQLGWEKAYLESVGHTIVNALADVLWYVGCGVPVCFDSFQGYNRPEE